MSAPMAKTDRPSRPTDGPPPDACRADAGPPEALPPDRLPRPPRLPPSPMLTVQPLGATIPLQPGQTLLQAALAAGIRLPASCRNGTCRTCMCRLAAGRVRYLIDWPGLLAEEKAEGWILPCVATADADLAIEAPGAAPQS